MQENSLNSNLPYTNYMYPQQSANPNAVSINIYSPQAYGNTQNPIAQQGMSNNFYPLYGPNTQNNMPIYPQNYNNMFAYPGQYPVQNQQQNPMQQNLNAAAQANALEKTPQPVENITVTEDAKTDTKEEAEEKVVTPLSDEYIKSLENYLNDSNSKVRLIGAKELMERFKEDDNRKDNKSLIPLLNKTLRDTSAAVRFLGLTTLQLGYCVGNDETVQILKEIQAQNKDKTGEDQLLASEILLKMAAPQEVGIKG